MAFPIVTSAFCTLASNPSNVEDQLHLLERFVVLLYDRTSNEEKVNEARKKLFFAERQANERPSTNSSGTH